MSPRKPSERTPELPTKPDQPSAIREQIFADVALIIGHRPTPNTTVPALLAAAELDAAFGRDLDSLGKRRLFASRLYLAAERALDGRDRHWQEMPPYERLELKLLRKYLVELARMVEAGTDSFGTRPR